MIIQRTYRYFALIMAFLMLFSSTSFAIDMHYCGGELKSINLFRKAKTCHELSGDSEKPMKDCPHHKKMMVDKKACPEDKGCCSNKTVQLESDQDHKVQANDILISKQLKQFVIAYVAVFIETDYRLEREVANFAYYRPPLIQKDIPVLNQAFLL